MKKLILFTLIALSSWKIQAQVYVEGGKTRHRFAQLNLGLDYRYFSGRGTSAFRFSETLVKESFPLADLNENRIIIGGTHFWGHADFFIAIPIVQYGKSNFKTGVETGFKIFPWRIENSKFRPYLGASWMPSQYQQGEGANQWRSRLPLTAGLVFNRKSHLIELGMGFIPHNQWAYFISKDQKEIVRAHPLWVSFSYKFILETTLGAEKDWLSGRTQKLTDTLATLKKLNGVTLALGPSSAFFSKKSAYNEIVAPYADQHKAAQIFVELGVGYYLHKPDIQLNIAYRNIKSEISAFDFVQSANRRALTFEIFKFFADYHGFVPFVGPSASFEMLLIQEYKSNMPNSASTRHIRPGITFGWDIRPNRIQSWYLRTNLRYTPALSLFMPNGEKFNFDQLEFNFIQFVLFPGRIF